MLSIRCRSFQLRLGLKLGLKLRLPSLVLLVWGLLVACLSQGAALSDPTRPLGQIQSLGVENNINKPPLVLNSIFIRPNKRFVIIDGKRFNLDDRVDEYLITSITSKRVILTGEAGHLELRLNSHGRGQNKYQQKKQASMQENPAYREGVND